jgi:glucose-1-phosphate cytidylyltransferase
MKKYHYPVVILAGGLGTRLREETEFRPKPMVPVGGRPIIWHIMKTYSHYGFYRFIICLGYKGDMIKDYFLNYHLDGIDFTVNTKTGTITEHQINNEDWEVTLVDTGLSCMTGARIARIARHIDTERFLVTYGDGLANVNIQELLDFHNTHKKLVTLTGVNIQSRFGNLEVTDNQITSFTEKKKIEDEWINGGFFVCEKNFLSYLSTDPACVLEQTPLKNVSHDGQLMMYKHNGFWQCMDTYREQQLLEDLWKKGAPWKIWQDHDKEYTPAVKTIPLESFDKLRTNSITKQSKDKSTESMV